MLALGDGSAGKVLALQAQSPEFKPQDSTKKEKKKKLNVVISA